MGLNEDGNDVMHVRRRLYLLLGAVAVVSVAAVHFSAFESYVLNITAHVMEPPAVVTKKIVKDPFEVITQEEVDAAYFAATGQTPDDSFDCERADTAPPILVPIETCVFWVLRIEVENLFENPISNVMVTDRFGSELAGVPLDTVPVHVEVLTHSRGTSGRQSFDTQYRILWCVTGNLIETDGGGECDKKGDARDLLLPGETATLDMLVFTKLNPSGRQEYTSLCADTGKALCYEMNSGATAHWTDTKSGAQMSASTDSIKVGTIQTTVLELNTDIAFGNLFPGEVRTDHFTLSLSDIFIAEGGQVVEYHMRLDRVPCPADGSDPLCPPGELYMDISPYIVILRDLKETDSTQDNTSGAVLNDKDLAAGPSGDVEDVWLVGITAPDFAGCSQLMSAPSAGVIPDSDACVGRTLQARLTIEVTGTDLVN